VSKTISPHKINRDVVFMSVGSHHGESKHSIVFHVGTRAMLLKRIPLWEGSYGNWKFYWGKSKDIAARRLPTGEPTLTAEEILNMATIRAYQLRFGYYHIAVSECPELYEEMEDKGLISCKPFHSIYHIGAYWEEWQVECDVLDDIPIPRLIESFLVEAGWMPDHSPERIPDRDDILKNEPIWQVIEVWIEQLSDEEMPEFLVHPHPLIRALAETTMAARKDYEIERERSTGFYLNRLIGEVMPFTW